MNSKEISELLKAQKTNLSELERLFRNYKKDGQSRKTETYLREKHDEIDYLWSEIEENDKILRQLHLINQPYFQNKSFDTAQSVYKSFIDDICKRIKTIENSASEESSGDEEIFQISDTEQDENKNITPTESNQSTSKKQQSTMLKADDQEAHKEQSLALFKLKLKEIEELIASATEGITSMSRGYRKAQIDLLKESWSEFRNCYFLLMSQNYDLQVNYSELQGRYVHLIGLLNESVDDNLMNDVAQMPKIKMPEFGGKISQWPSFIGLFDKMVHDKPTIDKTIKIQYLITSLKGEAAKLVSHIPPTGENYDSCYNYLQRRYNNKKEILGELLDAIFDFPKQQSENFQSLKLFHDTIFEGLMTIKNMKIDTSGWDPLLNHQLLKKLSRETVTAYETQLKDIRELQPFSEFMTFLETRFLALQSVDSQRKGNANKNAATFKCAICDGNHSIIKCETFVKKPVNERFALIKEKKLCVNCFKNHNKSECTSTYTCKTCNKPHNTLLHFEKSNANLAQISNTEEEEEMESVNAFLSANNKKVILATALVSTNARNGTTIALKALIDQGSQNAFISKNAVQLLKINTFSISAMINGIGQSSQMANRAVTISIKPRFVSNFSMQFDAIILSKLANLSNQAIKNERYEHLNGLILADPSYCNAENIDIILGAAEFAQIVKNGLIKGRADEPIAQKTELGWIISGETSEIKNNKKAVVSMVSNVDLDEKINNFFEFHEYDDEGNFTDEQAMCEDHYEKTHKRLTSGNYEVQIPFKNNVKTPELGDSRKAALATFFHLEKRFEKNLKLKTEYTKFINEYLSLGHMQLAEKTNNLTHYLPHHAILREDSTTTKLRVVFNASQKTMNGKSLNEQMAMGPLLQRDLVSIIIRWRTFKYAFTADIEKMYRQIFIADNQQDLQRILWRDSPNQPIREYKLKTITYGTANAPYLAIRTLFQLAQDEEARYPHACDVIRNCFYVDDVMYGAHDLEGIKQIYNELRAVMSSAGLNLRKWSANSNDFLQIIPDIDREMTLTNNTVKALGLRWDPVSDKLRYKVEFIHTDQRLTKRKLLSEMSSLFDPLGFICPIIIAAKEIFQSLWMENVDWDDEIPSQYREKWIKIRNELNMINDLEIDRWICSTGNASSQLIGFCDASNVAYAAVVYIKTIRNNAVDISMLMARARVAPINQKKAKLLTIPKLELYGALLLARLVKFVNKAMNMEFSETHLFSDSKVVLAWITGNPNRWKVSVSNRVNKINAIISKESWQHIPGDINPADIASRGTLPSILASNKLWWMGPSQLLTSNRFSINENTFETTEEEKTAKITALTTTIEQFELPNVSSYTKLKRVIAYVILFASNCRKHERGARITMREMRLAEITIIKIIQKREFANEIRLLKSNKKISPKSNIIQLSPFLDSHEILRVGGRLKNAHIPYNAKHQILLPSNNQIATLIISDYHKLGLHGGPRLTDALIRQKFWIIGSRKMVNSYVHNCIVCVKNKPRVMNQIMADLPEPRVIGNLKPFTNCAIDNTGEIMTKYNKGRGAKTIKSYATIFVCMATKAIHLELVGDLTAESFISALRRFVARRGNCRNIYSDNATCFVKANKLLINKTELEMEEYNIELRNELLRLNIQWHFSPPSGPHFNGLAEAAVKSIKTHLKKIMGSTLLTFEEMSTLLCQIEACVNSRPLCALSSNPNDLLPLTPGHFLIGQPLLSIPEENYLEAKVNWLTRWQLVQKMSQHFWDRWKREYLHELQTKAKWLKQREEPKENDLVLIKDDNAQSNKWPMARILKLHKGDDGLTRVVTVKTENNVLKRPIAKICLLPNTMNENKTEVVAENQKRGTNNILPIVTALFAMVFANSLLAETGAIIPYNITYMKDSMGLYFEEKTMALVKQSNWNIYCYFNYTKIQCELDCIKHRISEVENLCNGTHLEYQSCMNIKEHLDKHTRTLNEKNEIIESYRTERFKKSFWKNLGDALELISGTSADRMSLNYMDALHNISKNDEIMEVMYKNQTSILEMSMNILKNTHEEALNQADHMNELFALTRGINDTERAFQSLLSISLSIRDILIQYENRQNLLINIISDSHLNVANSLLITPNQLYNQLNIIRKYIDPGRSLVVEDAHILYNNMHIKPFISMDAIIFRITIPIFNNNKYRIFKIIPIPVNREMDYLWIQIEIPYLIISLDHHYYQLLTEMDYFNCLKHGEKEVVCDGPNHWLPSHITNCEFAAFSQQTELSKCKTVHTAKMDIWIEVGINRWFFNLPNNRNLISACDEETNSHQLMGSGVIELNKRCLIRGESILLNPIQDESSIPIRNSGDDIDAEILLGNQPRQLDIHDIHHYILIYIVLGGTIGIAIYIRLKKWTFNLERSFSMPNLAAPENVEST